MYFLGDLNLDICVVVNLMKTDFVILSAFVTFKVITRVPNKNILNKAPSLKKKPRIMFLSCLT